MDKQIPDTHKESPSVPNGHLDVGGIIEGQIFRERRESILDKVIDRVRRKTRRRHEHQGCFRLGLHWRILSVKGSRIVAILIEDPFSREEPFTMRQCADLIELRDWVESNHEPLSVLRLSEDALTPKQLATRDRNVAFIQPLIDLGDGIFEPRIRGPVIREICRAHRCAPMKVYRVLYRFFQGGMDINALAGRWFRRSRGTCRGARRFSRSSACGGRPRKAFGRPRSDGHDAFKITETDVKKLIQGADKFYFAPDGVSWRRAWLLMLGLYYIEVPPGADLLTEEEVAKYPPNSYPSGMQFYYWNKVAPNVASRLKKRVGKRKFELSHRPLGDRTERHAKGPGSHFIIDPTPFDLVVVHRVTRRPIGRLVVYIVVDAFSRLIVGFYVHLGNAGFDPASLALVSAAMDKVILCRQFGITIRHEDWPAACLAGMLIADSELSSLRAHALVERKVMKLRIVPAYRPDLKGLVEALLGSLNGYAKSLPGHTNGTRKRAEIAADATAALDHIQTNRIVIRWILSRNRRLLDDYSLSDDMIADGLVSTPINIWNWGVANCGGLRKKVTNDYLVRHCLPTGKARITRRGLEFQGHYFEPQEGYLPDFQSSRVEASYRTITESVTYNPCWVHDLWLHAGPDLIPMQLTKESESHATWSYADLDAFDAETRAAEAAAVSADVPQQVALETASRRDVSEAIRHTDTVRGTVAARRRERIDKPSERESQSDLIRGAPVVRRRDLENPTVPRDLADEDEAEAAQEILESLERENLEIGRDHEV